jgi:multidrug efflux pump subunit AcrB
MDDKDPIKSTLRGVDEVIVPVIISTLAIIASFTPMFFITGMRGPYMGPMAINVPLTVTFSTVCALTFVPWMHEPFKELNQVGSEADTRLLLVKKLYHAIISPLLKAKRNITYVVIILVLLGSVMLMFSEKCL